MIVLLTIAMATFAMSSFGQSAPVTASFAVSGDPAPGATVTVTATVTINDGSSLQGLQWSQTGGVDATLSGTTGAAVSVKLPSRAVFKGELIHVLEHPPAETGPLPGNAPVPDPYYGGLQSDRFGVVAASHLSVEEAGAVSLKLAVTTSSGTYNFQTAVHAHVPFGVSPGIRNVPIGVPVLLNGKGAGFLQLDPVEAFRIIRDTQ